MRLFALFIPTIAHYDGTTLSQFCEINRGKTVYGGSTELGTIRQHINEQGGVQVTLKQIEIGNPIQGLGIFIQFDQGRTLIYLDDGVFRSCKWDTLLQKPTERKRLKLVQG